MELGIRDRVAIVAASSRGLGRAVAEALAADGARLALCSQSRENVERTAEEIRKRFEVEVFARPVDLEQPAEIVRFVQEVASSFGRIDICVTNAPGPPVQRFLQADLAAWRKAIDLNLLGSVVFAQEVLPHMVAARWGRIVMMSSIVAKQPEEGFLLSNAVRPGVSGLVRTLAMEFGGAGITVNAVLPGTYATDRLVKVSSDAAAPPNFERWIRATPLGRLGRPEEFGAVVGFLCSEAAGFVNGASIPVDGGFARALL
ncbi:MAG: short-chain dehydrogenase/reductase [Myxococcaceae bacterium]|nr:short-chain dehydrogenase/reductase [Myxococcaceae bacterium]